MDLVYVNLDLLDLNVIHALMISMETVVYLAQCVMILAECAHSVGTEPVSVVKIKLDLVVVYVLRITLEWIVQEFVQIVVLMDFVILDHLEVVRVIVQVDILEHYARIHLHLLL